MTTSPIKAGDTVRCVSNSYMEKFLTFGKKYVVIKGISDIDGTVRRIRVINDQGNEDIFYADRFKLVETAPPEMKTKINITSPATPTVTFGSLGIGDFYNKSGIVFQKVKWLGTDVYALDVVTGSLYLEPADSPVLLIKSVALTVGY